MWCAARGGSIPPDHVQPLVQSEHAVLPALEVYSPAGHRSHFSVSAAAANEPGRHGAGSAEPTEHEVPAYQTTNAGIGWSRGRRIDVQAHHMACTFDQGLFTGQMMHWSREERKPVMFNTVWLACVPPLHGCGALLPSTHRSVMTRVDRAQSARRALDA